MSNSTTPSACGSISGVQPVAASRASVSRSITSSSRPISCATRARKSSPFSAARQASVAISRARVTPLFFILLRQIVSAAMARSIAASLMRPRAGDALAEPDDAGKRVDHAEAVAGRTRDQQTAIVGAEIERGIGRAAAIAAHAAVEPSGRPPTPSGLPWRRPIKSGVEARGIPGLAAHMSQAFLPPPGRLPAL